MYLAMFMGFFTSFFKAKVFTPDEIGVLATIFTLSLIVNIFIVFGSNSGILKHYVTFKSKYQKTGFILFTSLLPAIIMTIAALLFYIFKDFILSKFDDPLLSKYYNYIYVLFVFNYITTNMDMIFRAESLSKISNIINNFLNKLLTAIFLILVFLMMKGEFKFFFIVSMFLPGVQGLIFIFIYSKKVGFVKPNLDFVTNDYRKKYYTFTSFMFLSQAGNRFTEWIDKVFIGYYLNMSMVGIYTIVISFVNLVKLISRAINLSAGQQITRAWNENDTNKLQRHYTELANLPLSLGLIVLLFLVTWGKKVLLIFDETYVQGYYAMIILTVGALIELGTSCGGNILKYSKKYKFDLYIQFFLLTLAITTNIIFIPRWGINGAAFATAITIALYNLLKLALVYVFFKMQPYTLDTIKIILQYIVIQTLFIKFIPDYDGYNLISLFFIAIITGSIYILIGAYIFRIKELKDLVSVFINKSFNKGKK